MREDKSPVFTVIIPTYNREELLPIAIDSVLRQTFIDLELFVVDDGSEDGTKKVVMGYAEVDSRVRYIYKENGGQNSALNIGIKYANGYFIAFLDSDDYWMDNKLEKVYEKFQNNSDMDVVYHSTAFRKKNGSLVAVNNDYLEGWIYKEVLEQGFLAAQISLAAKKFCFERVGYYDETFLRYQDDDMCFSLAKIYKIGLIKEPLSVLGGEADNRVSEDLYRTAKYYTKLIEKYKEDILKYCGNEKLAEMYYKAMIKWFRVKSRKEAECAFCKCQEYRNGRKITRLEFELVFCYQFISTTLSSLKSSVWKSVFDRVDGIEL